MMDIATVFLNDIRVISGFLLMMFIPGFLITLIYYPKLYDISLLERLVYSAIISIGSVIVCVLFMDVFLGIDTTPANVVIVIISFCVILAFIWVIRKLFLTFSVTEKISESIKKFYGLSSMFFSRVSEKFHR